MRLSAIAVAVAVLLALSGAQAAAPEAEPAVIAHYALRRAGAAPEPLVIVRTGDRIEHRYPARRTVEVWRRVRGEEVERLALFPEAKRAVRYTQGDLRALGEPADWSALGGLVGAGERAALEQVGTLEVRGEVAPRLRGTLRGRPAALTWLPASALPAELTLGTGTDARTLRLRDLRPCTPERCTPTDTTGLAVLDFADLGDMTYDPFVRRFLRARGGHAH